MAEIFGVVAGAVGLLHLTVKAANILRGIPEIEDDFEELCEEIETITSWVDHAKLTISPVAAIVPLARHQLLLTARRLENISQSLREIEDRLKKETPNGVLKVKKATWLINSGKIAKLLQKAQRAKVDLSFAVQWQQHAQLNYLADVSNGISQGLIRSERIMTATLHNVAVLADNYPPGGRRPGQQQQRRVEELNESTTDADSERQLTTTFTKRSRQAPSSCPEGCACGCHIGSGQQRQKVDLMSSVLRYMGVHYNTPPWGTNPEPCCRCRGAWTVEYHPPWLRARVWVLSGNHHAPSPMFSLRAARIITYKDPVWAEMITKNSPHRLRDSIMNGTTIYPNDRSETGAEIIELVINNSNFAILQLLLLEWANILPHQGLTKRAGWEANRALLRGDGVLDEGKIYLLQQVKAFAEIDDDDDDEAAKLRVHEAARQGLGMADALAASQSWAKDALDNTGRAPLHWAAEQGHVEALQQLIDAGADVDIRDMNGWTPFMFAVYPPAPTSAI